MRKNYILGILLFIAMFGRAQNITLSIANAQITNDGSDDYYEADIMIASDADYVQGSGQFFLDYNTTAFGTGVQGSGAITFERPVTSILGTQSFSVDNYNSFVVNDNTSSKVSFLWQQFWSEGTIGANNVTATPSVLVHLKIRYIDSNEATGICFDTTSNSAFDDQFFTACGPTTGPAGADCGAEAGTQILDYTPDCTNAEPVPLSIGDEVADNLNISLFPNPANTNFKVRGLSSESTLTIFSLNGKRLLTKEDYTGEEIYIGDLASGLYLVAITADDSKIVKRLLVK